MSKNQESQQESHKTFLSAVTSVVGTGNVLTRDVDTVVYSQGFRTGNGRVLAVVFPQSLLEQWRVLEHCVAHDIIVIMQAANTGLTGGSTPDGDAYDRPVVIVKSNAIKTPYLLENGTQVIAFPGTALYELESLLKTIHREPHSVIGSSCIGASVIGGVCNSSGGALVQRGPAYTELALYAKVGADGTLELVNNLGIDLGMTPEDILQAVETGHFQRDNLPPTNLKASGSDYQHAVRQVDDPTPARYNANPAYLYETSGSAGKVCVFAVRLDTFPAPQQKKLFYLGTNDPTHFIHMRRHILAHFKNLPVLGEYLNRSAFALTRDYARDVYAVLTMFGSSYMPFFFRIKRKLDVSLKRLPFVGNYPMDKVSRMVFTPFRFLLPKRILQMGKKYDHTLFIEMSDDGIYELETYLREYVHNNPNLAYMICTDKEHKAGLNFRFSAGNGITQYERIQDKSYMKSFDFDVAYPRNDTDILTCITPVSLEDAIVVKNHISHFFCHVMHQSYVVDTRKCDGDMVEAIFKDYFAKRGAMYPAEHNFGHTYSTPDTVQDFYRSLDPTNSFNAGVGKMSKNKNYK